MRGRLAEGPEQGQRRRIDSSGLAGVGGAMGWGGRGLVTGMLVLAAASCTPRPRAPAVAPASSSAPATVAVLPFRVGGELDRDAAFAERHDMPPVPDDVGERIAATLGRDLQRGGVGTVDPVVALRATPPPGAARYDRELGARVAHTLGARFAIIGVLTRFVERQGSAWGATTPATVWYQAVLVDAAIGTVLDRQRFEYTQQPLSQNLLELPRFLQGGGRGVARQERLDGAVGGAAAD